MSVVWINWSRSRRSASWIAVISIQLAWLLRCKVWGEAMGLFSFAGQEGTRSMPVR